MSNPDTVRRALEAEIERMRALWLRASPLLQYLAQHAGEARTRDEATAILIAFHQPPTCHQPITTERKGNHK